MPLITKVMLEEENRRLSNLLDNAIKENKFLHEKLEFYVDQLRRANGNLGMFEYLRGVGVSLEASSHIIDNLNRILERKLY